MDQYATPIGPKKFLICPLSWLQKSGEKIANKSQKNFWEQKYWQILSSRIKCWTKKFSQQKILQEFESSFRWRQESERDIDRERVCVGLRVENEREREREREEARHRAFRYPVPRKEISSKNVEKWRETRLELMGPLNLDWDRIGKRQRLHK